MTLKSADRLLRKWQKRLRLQDWDIRLTENAEMGNDVWGRCSVWKNKQIADIEIAPAGLLHNSKEAPPMDELMVHELLHVIFVHHELGINIDDSAEHKHYERGIDKIAKVLIEGFKCA